LFKYKKEYQKPTIEEGFSNIEIIKFIRKDNSDFKQKALILDYDGCLRECVGGNGKFPISEDQIRILPRRKEILEDYKNKGYILLGISNQSGIAKKELTYNRAIELFDFTNKQLEVDIDYKFCPHQSAPIFCFCRKPQVGLFVDFMMKYKLSRKDCIFVGDLKTDETFAKRCGIKFFYAENFFNGN
jgi:D-glycero-D-manno-heptose 1,7-bisphosphate phosphatase